LSHHWLGPFTIKACVGHRAYWLTLPPQLWHLHLVIWPIYQLQTYSDASEVSLVVVKSFQHVLTLSDIDAQKSMTHETSKMCTYASQAIPMLSSTYTLKS
jgi:hypothetical protein